MALTKDSLYHWFLSVKLTREQVTMNEYNVTRHKIEVDCTIFVETLCIAIQFLRTFCIFYTKFAEFVNRMFIHAFIVP